MDIKQIKIVFMGTPDIAASLLRTLIDLGFNIVALITQKDAPIGRQGLIKPVPTKEVATSHGIPIFQPESIRNDHEFIKEVACDLLLTLAYGQIVPDAVLAWPKYGALNVHGSLLPKLRGAAPLQYALMQGLEETGITLMRMVSKMDAGGMFANAKLQILPDDNYCSLKARMSTLINQEVPVMLQQYISGQLQEIVQDESEVTFAPSIKKEQEHIDIKLSCVQFINYIRALAPEPGAYLLDEKQVRIKLFKAHYYDDHTDWDVGVVLVENNVLILQLSDGRIAIDELQLPGKRITTSLQFLRGYPKIAGSVWK